MAVGSFSLFLLVAGAFSVAIATCPAGFIQHGLDCLYFSPKQESWNAAQNDCHGRAAFLASDISQDRHNFIKTYLNIFSAWKLKRFWIGGSDLIIEGQWRWAETGTPITGFSAWDAGQPDGNLTSNCMTATFDANQNLVWHDDRCTHSNNFICQTKATGPMTTTVPVIG